MVIKSMKKILLVIVILGGALNLSSQNSSPNKGLLNNWEKANLSCINYLLLNEQDSIINCKLINFKRTISIFSTDSIKINNKATPSIRESLLTHIKKKIKKFDFSNFYILERLTASNHDFYIISKSEARVYKVFRNKNKWKLLNNKDISFEEIHNLYNILEPATICNNVKKEIQFMGSFHHIILTQCVDGNFSSKIFINPCEKDIDLINNYIKLY